MNLWVKVFINVDGFRKLIPLIKTLQIFLFVIGRTRFSETTSNPNLVQELHVKWTKQF